MTKPQCPTHGSDNVVWIERAETYSCTHTTPDGSICPFDMWIDPITDEWVTYTPDNPTDPTPTPDDDPPVVVMAQYTTRGQYRLVVDGWIATTTRDIVTIRRAIRDDIANTIGLVGGVLDVFPHAGSDDPTPYTITPTPDGVSVFTYVASFRI